MSFIESLNEIVKIGRSITKSKPDISNAQLRRQSKNRMMEMRSVIDNEKDPTIKNILEMRFQSGIYKYDDLYHNKKD